MIDYALILSINYPTAEWSLAGDSYDGLTWFSTTPKPTQTQLDVLWESTQSAYAAEKESAATAKQSALSKLSALGLTEAEIKALTGN